MAEHASKLDVKLMAGVGAAFDIHAGLLRDSPAWVKASGLQWLDRLRQEPRRLWRRYLGSNPAFIWNVALQMFRFRRFSIEYEQALFRYSASAQKSRISQFFS